MAFAALVVLQAPSALLEPWIFEQNQDPPEIGGKSPLQSLMFVLASDAERVDIEEVCRKHLSRRLQLTVDPGLIDLVESCIMHFACSTTVAQ
jgi:hypothetical protein